MRQICFKLICFNHTNDKIHIPRTPKEEERKILDEIFKDSKHFSEFKSCAKMILIFFKIEEKSSPGSNFEKKKLVHEATRVIIYVP